MLGIISSLLLPRHPDINFISSPTHPANGRPALRGPDGDQAISVGLPANAGPSSEIFDPINQNMTLRYQLDGLSIEVLQTVT